MSGFNLVNIRTDPLDDPRTRGNRLLPEFTEAVNGQTGPNADARVRTVVAGLVRHMHALVKEEHITIPEINKALEFVTEAAKKHELLMVIGTLGFGSIARELTFEFEDRELSGEEKQPSKSAGLGPFWRPDAPVRQFGQSIVDHGFDSAAKIAMSGKVIDFKTGRPVVNAEIDIWQAGDNGLYDHQDPEQPMWNLRGRFKSRQDGSYCLICLRSTPYPLPTDGPTGDFLRLLDRHPFRPGHLHFKVLADGFLPLISEFYERDDRYLDSDVVFDVHDRCLMDVVPKKSEDEKTEYELDYDFKLVSVEYAERNGLTINDWFHE